MAGIHQLRSATTHIDNHRPSARKEINHTSQQPLAAKKTQQPRGDAVSLSSQGKEIGQLHNKMASEPSFDNAKVAAIKEAIANGSYRVDAEKLADNIRRMENGL